MYPTIYSALRRYWRGGREIRRCRNELEQTQWLSRLDLERWQLARLRSLVRHAYENVPYYRRTFDQSGIGPDDIRSVADFQALPCTTRDDVNNHLEEFVASGWRSRVTPNSTGGSTGQPMQFYVDPSYHWRDWALELRGRSWYGVRDGDKIAWVWGAQRDMPDWTGGARLKAALTQQRYLNAFSMSEAKMDEFVAMLVRWQPVMIRAYASALSLLAERIRDRGIGGIKPMLIEVTAEKVTELQRELLTEVFACPVADWYTAREFGTIGFQCPAGSLHICESRYVEIATDGHAAQPGELGEVVITSLHQYGMPFIRYKIGDMGVRQDEPCVCGRGLPVLSEVVGRAQDFLMTAEGEFVHGGYFPHTLRNYPEISRYQVYQPDGHHLEVRLVRRGETDERWLDHLHTELKDCFGSAMQISITCVDKIDLTASGKHRPVISEVAPGAGIRSSKTADGQDNGREA